MITSIMLIASMAVAADSFTEDFGDIITTCDAVWYGDCESGWAGSGSNGTIDVCADGTEAGVGMIGGSVVPNGIKKLTHVLDADTDEVEWGVKAMVLDGSGELIVRVIFRDSGGLQLDAITHSETVAASGNDYFVEVISGVPSGTYSVDLVVGATDPDLTIWTWQALFGGKKKDPPSTPPTDAECQTRAGEKEAEKEASCAGTGDYTCTGSARNGDCFFICYGTCSGSGLIDTAPADVSCSSGF